VKRIALAAALALVLVVACSSAPTPTPSDEPVADRTDALVKCEFRSGFYTFCLDGSGCCNGVCTDLSTSTDCGACGNVCGKGTTCTGGHCCAPGTKWCNATSACVASACDCAPDLEAWLTAHPNVAAQLKWQYKNSTTDGYTPAEADKVAWASWPASWRADLVAQYRARYKALCKGQAFAEPLADPLPNSDAAQTNDGLSPATQTGAAIAQALYTGLVAHTLAVELGGFVPWSITGYDAEGLAVLLDSATMMSRLVYTSDYALGGWYSPYEAPTRAGNRGRALPAPPSTTFAFMSPAMVKPTRRDTILALMQWGHDHMVHFYGYDTFGNHDATWQYRGHPPVSRVIGGTNSTSAYLPAGQPSFEHWTAGCHGTAGFFREALRVVNIPVQIPRSCGHSQLYFRTEGLYVDHADDIYNGYGTFPVNMADLLIDQATYTAWFGTNLLKRGRDREDRARLRQRRPPHRRDRPVNGLRVGPLGRALPGGAQNC